MAGLRYGKELPDQVEVLNTVLEHQLALLGDIRDLVRERAALEKEYSGKLQAIARKAAAKRLASAGPRIVGDDPTKTADDSIFGNNTLEAAYAMLIEAYDTSSQDHASLSEALTAQVAQDLKNLEQKKDGTRKKQLAAFQKALSDRDRIYGDRVRSKQKYDEECLEIETHRQKQTKSASDRHADRAAKQYEHQKVEMLNAKNTYLTSIAVANKVKEKFYAEDLPEIENQFQDIQTALTSSTIGILKAHQHLATSTLAGLQYKLNLVDAAIGGFDPSKDQELFVEYNRRPAFLPPSNWEWEPCTGFYDSGTISVEPEPKTFLQNKLARAQTRLDETRVLINARVHDSTKLEKLLTMYQKDPKLGDPNEVMDDFLDSQHTRQQLTTVACALEAEIAVLVEALGDDQGARQPHTFKSSSFSIPTPCGFCKSSIWGLSKQGKTCKACGLAVHNKCELKVPAECGGASGGKRAGGAGRVPASMPSRTSSATPSTASRLTVSVPDSIAPTPTASTFGASSAISYQKGTILFDFVASSPFELNVSEGDVVNVVEDDDGSGWIKVGDIRSGEKGLVPATYVEMQGGDGPATPTPMVPANTRSQGSGKFVKGLYAYQAQGDDELAVRVGGRIELTAVGESYGDGWSEGVDVDTGKKGIFPSNYVQLA